MDWAAQETDLATLLHSYAPRLIGAAVADAEAVLGRPVRTVAGDPRARALAARLAEHVGGIVATQRAAVEALINEHAGDQAGLAAALRDRLALADAKAAQIAHDATSTAYNLGTVYAGRVAGVPAVRVSDGHYDAGCAALDGTTQTLEWAEAHPLAHSRCKRRFSLAV